MWLALYWPADYWPRSYWPDGAAADAEPQPGGGLPWFLRREMRLAARRKRAEDEAKRRAAAAEAPAGEPAEPAPAQVDVAMGGPFGALRAAPVLVPKVAARADRVAKADASPEIQDAEDATAALLLAL